VVLPRFFLAAARARSVASACARATILDNRILQIMRRLVAETETALNKAVDLFEAA
jgi:hypothetical protein